MPGGQSQYASEDEARTACDKNAACTGFAGPLAANRWELRGANCRDSRSSHPSANIFIKDSDFPSGCVGDSYIEVEEVPCLSGSEVLAKAAEVLKSDVLDLMIVDAEGFDADVLASFDWGARQDTTTTTMMMTVRSIMFESEHMTKETTEKVTKMLSEGGYLVGASYGLSDASALLNGDRCPAAR